MQNYQPISSNVEGYIYKLNISKSEHDHHVSPSSSPSASPGRASASPNDNHSSSGDASAQMNSPLDTNDIKLIQKPSYAATTTSIDDGTSDRFRQHSGAALLANAAIPRPIDAPKPPFLTVQSFTADQFMAIVEEVRAAIASGIQPIRISQGSSGSYFCKNRSGQIVAVFKPKNEEPYGQLNPKWTKWLHKTCCPCCFGRSCLIPNSGYISEAAASLIDRHLGLNVVPRTEVVTLASPSFFYSYVDKTQARRLGGTLPSKIGSFQLFMHGYMDATKFMREGPRMIQEGRLKRDELTGGLHSSLQTQFQDQFERLVILDYMIRNTDRGLDNWMVRYDEPTCQESPSDEEQGLIMVSPPSIYVAAIDNGLAFPFKHPDQWRSYPYGWSFLPASRVPFSRETRERMLPLLTSKAWWENLIRDLRMVFSLDSDFDEKLFRRQVAIMKGQVYNLVRVLSRGIENQTKYHAAEAVGLTSPAPSINSASVLVNMKDAFSSGTPLDLVNQPCCLVWEDADVRDMAGGHFGADILGRDGLLGTIINAIDPTTPMSSSVASSSKVIPPTATRSAHSSLKVDVTPLEPLPSSAPPSPSRAKVFGDFLTSPGQMQVAASYDPGYLHDAGKRELESHRIRSHSLGRRRIPRLNTENIGQNLDAFRGKVITFVKSQPWFRRW